MKFQNDTGKEQFDWNKSHQFYWSKNKNENLIVISLLSSYFLFIKISWSVNMLLENEIRN